MFWPSDGSEFQSHRKLCSPWCWGRQRPRWCSWRMKIWESGRGLGYGGGQRNTGGGLWMALKGKRRIPKWPGGTEEFFEMCWEEGVRDDAGGALELMVDFFFFFWKTAEERIIVIDVGSDKASTGVQKQNVRWERGDGSWCFKGGNVLTERCYR